MVGGDDVDTADYSASVLGVTINLGKQGTFNVATNIITGATAQTGGDAAGDLLSGIENVIGSSAKDVFISNAAAHKMDGGGSVDTVNYTSSTLGVTANLTNNAANTGDAAGDTYVSIENLIGTAKNDTLVGDVGANTLDGGTGGDDTLVGGDGADQLIGGMHTTGIGDTADYSASAFGVTVNLAQQGTGFNAATGLITGPVTTFKAQTGGDAAGDTLFGIENVIGSAGIDVITGDSNVNLVDAGDSGDTLDGGAGIDTLTYAKSDEAVTIALNGATVATGIGGHADGDKVSNFENVIGSDFGDEISGDTFANFIDGGKDNDKLSGGGGTDTLLGGEGDDSLNGGLLGDKLIGGAGIDTADYSTSALGVTINLSKQGTAYVPATGAVTGAVAQVGGDAAGDLLSGIENVIGSSKDDLFTGSADANKFTGGGGTLDTVTYIAATAGLTVDMLVGGNGTGVAKGDTFDTIERLIGTNFNDTLTAANTKTILDGGLLDDTLLSGDGADVLIGGAGIDTVSYLNASAKVTVDLSIKDGTYNAMTGAVASTGLGFKAQDDSTGGDYFIGIENVTGSSYGDTLKGNSGANRLDGGSGDDTLIGGLGDDFLEGNDGSDTADYSAATGPVTANLAKHTATAAGVGTDTLSNVEGLVGSIFKDMLTGDEFDNAISGGDGDDFLDGGAGADTFTGGDGIDTLTYVSATSGVTFSLKTPANSEGDAAGDTFTDTIEIIQGSNFADDIEGNGDARYASRRQGQRHPLRRRRR